MVPEKEELTRKRVLYIGSAVPLETAEGLEAVQGPLSERYPVDDDSNIEGILSHVSVVPGGITLQYVSDPSRILFFPMSSLTLCAAVRCVSMVNAATGERTSQFVSLSSPAAGGQANSKRPAIFTAITRRTEGRKVLECHGFICSSSKDALELVQCTSFADRSRKGRAPPLPPQGSSASSAATLDRTGDYASVAGTTPRNVHHHTTHAHAHTNAHAHAGQVNKSSASGSAGFSGGDPETGDHAVRLVPGERGGVGGGDRDLPTDQHQNVAPEFYEPPPEHGYFYKTRDSEIKTYSVERMTDGDAERIRVVPPQSSHQPPPGVVVGATLPRPLPPGLAAERRPPGGSVVMGGGGGGGGGGMMVGGPGSSFTLPHHPGGGGRTVIPVRALPHPPGTTSGTTTLIRPRFFSPPPPMLRPRALVMGPPGGQGQGHLPHHVMAARDPYVFLPPPPPAHFPEAPVYGRSRQPWRGRGGSESSSRGSSASSTSSSSSSSPRPARAMNGRGGVGRGMNGDGGAGGGGEGGASSDVSSRPRSPPTDYDRGPRVSRKDQFHRHQRHLREVNGVAPPGMGGGHPYATLPGGGGGGAHVPHHHHPHPPPPGYDLYLYPPPPPHHQLHPHAHHRYPPYHPAAYPPATSYGFPMERARSMPPPVHRGKSKGRKAAGGGGGNNNKKDKKKKKKKKAGGGGGSKHRGFGGVPPSDLSTDSVGGYTSEVGPGGEYPPRMPRDFRRLENQFKHERAFSKSLAQESIRGGPGETSGNAYSLNEHMAQRGLGPDGTDFHMY